MSRVAAVDCGTNSIRLLISEAGPHGPRDLVRQMRIVRLGEGVDATGRLSQAALQRTETALREYADLVAAHDVSAVRMVATSASRDADNAEEFRTLVADVLGVQPEVISGETEAELSFTGAVADLPVTGKPRLVVDIGGGSTEFVRGVAHAEAMRSVDVGCVRMTERRLRDDPPTADQVAAAVAEISAAADAALDAVDPDRHAEELVGLAGSVTTVAGIALGLESYQPEKIHHAQISYDDVCAVTAQLLSQTRRQRLQHPVMHPGRADVIASGALVLRTVMQRGEASQVTASEHDILDGIAASLR